MAKKFTAEEDKYILEHWQDGEWSVIADVLGRTSSSVRQRANKLMESHCCEVNPELFKVYS